MSASPRQVHVSPYLNMQTEAGRIRCQDSGKENCNYFTIPLGPGSVQGAPEGKAKTETALCSELLVFLKTAFYSAPDPGIFGMIVLLGFTANIN